MEQSRRFLAVLKMSNMALDVAKRRVGKIRGLVDSSKKLLGSDIAENIYLSAIAARFVSLTKVTDDGNIITSYGLTNGGRIKYLLIMLLFPAILLAKLILAIIFHPKSIGKYRYKCGVRIFDGDFGFNYGTGRGMDFIVGGGLDAKDVLFCPETSISSDYTKGFKGRRYKFLPLKYCFLFGDSIGALRAWPGFLYHSMWADSEEIRISIDILLKYIHWTGFLNMVDFDVYLVYGDYIPTSLVRTILFNRAGIKVWYYCNSYAYWYMYTGGEMEKEWILAFYACDKVIAWGDVQKRFIEIQSDNIGSVECVGCLWSGQITRIPHEGKVVSVFNSPYGGYGPAPSTNADMLMFLKDIVRLANEREDITILYKPKTLAVMKTEPDEQIRLQYEALERHPRVNIVTDGVKAISTSDLVITGPYSSPTFEALSAGVKGIYHDASGLVRSDLCEGIPNLVSHNYDELVSLVDYWLDDVNPIIFNVFLQMYILGEVDIGLDQKGVERLREMILNERVES